MPGMFVITPGTQITLHSERLRVIAPRDDEGNRPEPHDVAISDVEHVILTEHCSITMPAMAKLMRKDIPVVLTAHGDDVLGICMPPGPDSKARLAQYRKTAERTFTLAISTTLVEAKVLNTRRVLQRLSHNRTDINITPTLDALEQLARHCHAASSIDTLRGYEGTAAGRYFEAYGGFFPETCPFEYRSRRPPHNAVNAILSYAYTLLAAEINCRIHVAGLDPAIGFFHEPADRRPSLALDLMEPFRAPIADAMALDLVTHNILNPTEHFESRDGGVYLNLTGKRRFFTAFERRMARPFHSEQIKKRTCLRDEMHRAVYDLKRAINEGTPILPFIMN